MTEDTGIEPVTVAMFTLAAKHPIQSARYSKRSALCNAAISDHEFLVCMSKKFGRWTNILHLLEKAEMFTICLGKLAPVQGCGSGSGTRSGSVLDSYSIGYVDPDPDPYSESGSRSGSRRTKMTHKSRKKLVKVHVLKCWMASFES